MKGGEIVQIEGETVHKPCTRKRKRSYDSRNSLIFMALQDGLEPEYMKPTEIIRNYKKLNTNKLHKRIKR